MQSKKLYYLTNFFFSMATAGMLLQVPYFAQKRFAPSWVELAYLPAIFGLSYMVLAPLMGHIGSRSSRRGHFLSLGCLGVFLGSIVLFFAQNMYWLYAHSLLYSLSLAFFYPNMIGVMGQANSMLLISRQAARFSLGWAVPLSISPMFSGYLLDIFHEAYDKPQLAFPVVGCLALVAGILSLKIKRMDRKQQAQPPVELDPEERAKLPAGGLLFWLMALFMMFTVRSSAQILFALFPAHAAKSLGFSALNVGILLGMLGISQVIVFWFMGRFHFWHFKHSPFYAAPMSMILGLVSLSFADKFIPIAGAFMLFGMAAAISYHFSMFYGLVTARNKERAGGVHESVLMSGNMLVVYLAAQAKEFFDDTRAAYYVGVLFCLVFLLAIITTSLVIRNRGRGQLLRDAD